MNRVSLFGADIQFNERKTEYDWNKIVQNKSFYKFVRPTTLCYNKSYEKKINYKLKKRILHLSFWGSVLFIVAEGIMAWITHSHSLLTDCLFDAADLVMIGPFLVLVPLLYKPVTEKHPYGYAQVESLFLLVKYSALLALTCNLLVENVKLLLHGGHEVDAGDIAIFEFFSLSRLSFHVHSAKSLQ